MRPLGGEVGSDGIGIEFLGTAGADKRLPVSLGPGPCRLPIALRVAPHEEPSHPKAPAARKVVALLLVEALDLCLVGRIALGLGDDGLDDGRHDVPAHAAVVARQSQLEAPLHEQLLVDQAVQYVAPLLGAQGLAAIARQGLQCALVFVRTQDLAVHRGHRALGQVPAHLRAPAHQARRCRQ